MKDNVKKALIWIGAAVIFIIIVVPYIVISILLNRQGKRIELYPEIKVVDIKNESDIDSNALAGALAAAQAISKKIASKQKKK